MITNGTIKVLGVSGGGVDSNGDPIKATAIASPEIDCFFKLKTDKKFSYDIGESKVSTYEIHIDTQEFTSARIRLTDDRNQAIGDFDVLSVEYLDIAQRIKITV
jgi:hypothetical protein